MKINLESKIISYLPELKKYAWYLTRDSEDKNDLVQEVMLKAFSNIGSYMDDITVKGWLMIIMKNTHINNLLRNKSHRGKMLNFKNNNHNGKMIINRKKLKYIITSSGRNGWESVYLRVFFDFSCNEICGFLDRKLTAVLADIHRFKKYMNKNYKMEDFLL